MVRYICIMVFANKKTDGGIGNKFKPPEFKGEFYATLAMKSGSADVCDSAPADARDKCYMQMAQKLGDAASCEKIKVANERENCISNHVSRTGDGSLCVKITNVNTRDYCYINASRNNPSYCDEISSPNVKQDCLRNLGR